MSHTFRIFSEATRERLLSIVRKAPLPFVAELDEPRRTSEQNKKMHAMLTDVARAKPEGRVYDTETWKCLFMDELNFKPRWVPSLSGDGVVNTGYRSSRLNKSQMSDMIEQMYAYGAEHGVEWSEPKQPETRAA
jgi:hypothetical protein